MTTRKTSEKLSKILNIKASICLGKVVGEYTYKGVIHDVKNPLVAYEGRYSADDLAPVLPWEIVLNKNDEVYLEIIKDENEWKVNYIGLDCEGIEYYWDGSKHHKDLAEAMGLMVLWLNKQGLISKKFLKK